MSDVILSVVIAFLLAFLGWREREIRAERSKFINALLAKNASEMASLEFVDKVKPQEAPQPDPLLSTADMSDEEFDEYIQKELENGTRPN